MVVRRFRRGRPLRRKFGRRRTWRRRATGAQRVHVIKRLGMECQISMDTSGNPTASETGNGSLAIGAPMVGSLPSTLSFGGGFQFKLSSAQQYTDLTGLFDRYKLTGVKLIFMYAQNIADAQSLGCLPTMWYAQDFDDTNIPTTSTQVLSKQYCRVKTLNGNNMFSIFIRPRLTKALTAAGVIAGDTTERPCFIDCSYPDVPHYGLKFWIDQWHTNGSASVLAQSLRIQPVYYFKLKDTQ